MAGYANAVITEHFPDLSAEGDDVFVTIRNPKTVPPKELTAHSRKAAKAAADGEPAEDGADDSDEMAGSNGIFARLIIRCHAYDGTSVDAKGNMRALRAPLSPEDVATLPWPIFQWLGEELAKLNPPKPTASPEESTSKE